MKEHNEASNFYNRTLCPKVLRLCAMNRENSGKISRKFFGDNTFTLKSRILSKTVSCHVISLPSSVGIEIGFGEKLL